VGGHFKEKVEGDEVGTDEMLSDMVGDNISGRSVSTNSSPPSSLDTPNKVCGINVVEIVLVILLSSRSSLFSCSFVILVLSSSSMVSFSDDSNNDDDANNDATLPLLRFSSREVDHKMSINREINSAR